MNENRDKMNTQLNNLNFFMTVKDRYNFLTFITCRYIFQNSSINNGEYNPQDFQALKYKVEKNWRSGKIK